MSSELNGSRLTPPGQRVPTNLLPNAIRYEAARAVLFEQFGDFVHANRCIALTRYYERRAREECISEPPTVAKDSNPGPT